MSATGLPGFTRTDLTTTKAMSGWRPMPSAEIESIIADKLRERGAIDAAVERCREEYNRAVENFGSKDLERIYNLFVYICLSERDQNVFWVNTLRTDESDHAQLSLIARQWATLLYEVAGTLRQKALTQPMRDTILALNPAAKDELDQVNSLAQQFWNQHSQELKGWRNTASAHRDFDAFLQLQAVQEVDIVAITGVAVELGIVTKRMFSLLMDVLTTTTGLHGALKIIARAKK
jgi:hypothetical protein